MRPQPPSPPPGGHSTIAFAAWLLRLLLLRWPGAEPCVWPCSGYPAYFMRCCPHGLIILISREYIVQAYNVAFSLEQ